ncbi:MAG: hypothetical protein OXC72_01450 [Roseovarius sp.]|nr:hypothetical protein [Roseovarius sp.]
MDNRIFMVRLSGEFRNKIFHSTIAFDGIAVTAKQLKVFNMVCPPLWNEG